jgi:hypothetical protein
MQNVLSVVTNTPPFPRPSHLAWTWTRGGKKRSRFYFPSPQAPGQRPGPQRPVRPGRLASCMRGCCMGRNAKGESESESDVHFPRSPSPSPKNEVITYFVDFVLFCFCFCFCFYFPFFLSRFRAFRDKWRVEFENTRRVKKIHLGSSQKMCVFSPLQFFFPSLGCFARYF